MKKTVLVKFPKDRYSEFSEKEYAYFTDDDSIIKDDWVVVFVRDTPRTVKVIKDSGLSKAEIEKACKWVVCKLDFTTYEEAMTRRVLLQELENTLDEIMAQEQRYAIYEKYAETNPKMASILSRIKALENGSVLTIDSK